MGVMTLQNTGHVAIAEAIYAKTMYLAWGDLPPFLGPPVGVTSTALNTGGTLSPSSYSYIVTAMSNGGETVASTTVSSNVSSSTGSVSISWNPVMGAIGYNVYKKQSNLFYMLATTNNTYFTDNGSLSINTLVQPPTTDQSSTASWTTTPPAPGTNFTGLYREVGRRLIQKVQYVYPDPNGVYVTSAGRWSISDIQTRYIYCYIAFDLTDAVTSTIYQFGIFMDTVPIAGYTNSAYLLPSQMSNPGTLLNIVNIPPIIRNASSSETYQVVLTF